MLVVVLVVVVVVVVVDCVVVSVVVVVSESSVLIALPQSVCTSIGAAESLTKTFLPSSEPAPKATVLASTIMPTATAPPFSTLI